MRQESTERKHLPVLNRGVVVAEEVWTSERLPSWVAERVGASSSQQLGKVEMNEDNTDPPSLKWLWLDLTHCMVPSSTA